MSRWFNGLGSGFIVLPSGFEFRNASSSAAGVRLHDIGHAIGGHGSAELGAIVDWLAVGEDRHVFPQRALIVEDITLGRGVARKTRVQGLSQGGTGDRMRRSGDVSLDALRESDLRYANHANSGRDDTNRCTARGTAKPKPGTVAAARSHQRPPEPSAAYSGITIAMCSSLSCFSVTGVGLWAMRSCPFCVFGKAMTSRMLVVPQSSAHMRSRPKAMPPCGGAP